MPTVIDSLTISLGLDPSKFTDGSRKYRDEDKKNREEASKSAKDMERSNKNVADSFTNIKREALGAFAVIVGTASIEKFVASSVSGFTKLSIAARQANVDVRQMAAFDLMNQRNGGAAGAAPTWLSTMAGVMEAWKTGVRPVDSQMNAAFNQIGVGGPTDPMNVYRRFAAWAQKQKDPTLVAQTAGWLGITDPSMTDMAMNGQASVDKGMANALKNVPTNDAIKKMKELYGAFFDLRQAITGDAQELLGEWAPALIGTLDATTKFVKENKALVEGIMALTAAMIGLKAVGLGIGISRAIGGGGAAAGAGAAAGGGWLGALGLWGFDAWLAHEVFKSDTGDHTEDARVARVNAAFAASKGGGGGGDIATAMASHGASQAAIQGVLAGVYAEGGGIGMSKNGAFGIGQWRGKRLKELLKRYGPNPTRAQEVQYLMWELQGGDAGGRSVLNAATSDDALWAYIHNFMRPDKGKVIGSIGDMQRGRQYLAQNGAPSITTGPIYITLPGVKNPQEFAKALPGALNKKALTNQANGGLS